MPRFCYNDGMTTTEHTPKNYLVVNYTTGHVWSREPNYHLALAAWKAASALTTDDYLAVRTTDDPQWADAKDAPHREYPDTAGRVMWAAVRKVNHDELANTARWAIKHHGELRFESLVRLIVKSLRERGFPVERWEAERALKDRVTLGRSSNTGKGYWFPKRKGDTLTTMRGPNGEYLNQTSLALASGFESLDAAKQVTPR